MTHILAIDQGTTSSRAIVFDERHGGRRHRPGGVPAAFPAVGLGRARPRRPLVLDRRGLPRRDRAGRARARRRSRRSASPTSARPRWSGTGRPASRSGGRSSGRTAAPARSAPSCAPPGTSRWSPSAPACCSTPTSRAPSSSGCSTPTPARASGRARGELLFGTVDTLADLEADRRPRARHRRHQRRAHAALQHPRAAAGTRTSARCSTCRWRCCRRCATRAADFGETRADLFGRAVPILGVAGDQQAATVGQACFAPGHAEGDLRHRLLRRAQHRRHAGREPQPAARPPSPTSSTAARPTRSKARSSSPAPWSSGCATG